MKLPSPHLNISNFSESVKKNLSLLLLICLVLIVLLVGYVVYQEVRKMSQVTADTSGVTGQIVRVNLTQHQELSNRLDESQRFVPKSIPGNSIFSTAPKISQ